MARRRRRRTIGKLEEIANRGKAKAKAETKVAEKKSDAPAKKSTGST